MTDLHYISWMDFNERVPQSAYHRTAWECLSESERYDIYRQVHDVIDYDFEYVGEQINIWTAFPRSFEFELNSVDVSETMKEFLRKYDRKIPDDLKPTSIFLARDILDTKEIHDVIVLREKAGADRVEDGDVQIEMGFRTIKYSNKALNFLDKLRVTYFALNNKQWC